MATHQVEAGPAVRERFQDVLAIEDVEESAPDRGMLVQRCRGNLLAICVDRKTETSLRFPPVDGFDEEDATSKVACRIPPTPSSDKLASTGLGNPSVWLQEDWSSAGRIRGTRSMFRQTVAGDA